MKHVIQVTKPQTVASCDICQHQDNYPDGPIVLECVGCGRDICSQCGLDIYKHQVLDYSFGRQLICEACWNVSTDEYKQAIDIAKRQLERTKVQVAIDWQAKCKLVADLKD